MQHTQQVVGGTTTGSHMPIGGASQFVRWGFTPLVPPVEKQVDLLALRKLLIKRGVFSRDDVAPELLAARNLCKRHNSENAIRVTVTSCLLDKDDNPTACEFTDGSGAVVVLAAVYIYDVSQVAVS